VWEPIGGSIWQTGTQMRGWRKQSHVATAVVQILVLRTEAIPGGAGVVAAITATITGAIRKALVLFDLMGEPGATAIGLP
jgi:hypothetical protein